MPTYPTYKLGEICELLNGYAFKSSKYVQSGLRVIRITNVKKGYVIDEEPQFYPIETREELKKYILKKDDLLISLTGNVGRVGILNEKLLPAALNQRVGCLRIKDKSVVSLQYLYHLLNTNSFEKDCINSSRGIAQKNMSTEWLKDYEVSLPPLPTQHQIVSRIESLFAELDKAVENLRTAQQQLKTYRQAVLKNAFEGCVEMVKVKDVCDDIKVGIVIKPSQYYTSSENGIRAFRSANIKEFSVCDSDWVYLTKEGHNENLRSEIHSGDVLVVRSGYPGTACVVPDKYDGCNAIDVLIAVPNKNRILPQYLCAYTNSPWGRKVVQEKQRGVAQAHFNVSGYSETPIFLPSLPEQQRIVKEIESRLSQAEAAEARIAEALQKTEALRQSILKKAFSGELV